MKIFFGVAFYFLSLLSYADMSFEANKVNSEQKAKSVKESLRKGDIGEAARLRVEGASFRAFNLYLPEMIFEGKISAESKKLFSEFQEIVKRDLAITGNFSLTEPPQGKSATEALMKQKGAEGSSIVKLSLAGEKLSATIENKNFISNKKTFKAFSLDKKNKRKLAHLVAQNIFQEFIGPEDLFLLQIAAVKRNKSQSQIVLMDFDGFNEQEISSGPWAKSTPFFTPSGESILYSVVTKDGQGIVEQKIGSKQITFRVKKDGLNLDPRVLPNNLGLLATLSLGRKADIYRVALDGKVLGAVTDSIALNLSPALSQDGRHMAFVSTRGGTPQIYEQEFDLNNKKPTAKRLTFQGRYNQTPQYSPDKKFIAFTGRDEEKVFDVFLIERESGRISRITEKQGRNQEPFFTPSGRFVVFSSERDGRKEPDLYLATLNGAHQYRLTRDGGYISPVIRPIK